MKYRMFIGVFVIALAGLSPAQEKQAEQIIVPLTNPDRPGKLILERHQGSITVKGYEGTVVLIKAFFRRSLDGKLPGREAEGMKPIPVAAIQLDAQEVGNVVTVNAHTRSKSVDVDVLVPFRFSVKLGVRDDGDVVVEDLAGEVEVDNRYGRVRLARLTGSANVNTIDEEWTTGRIGHGGTDVLLKSLDGNVYIRKSKRSLPRP